MQKKARERQRPRLSTARLIGLLSLVLLSSCGTDESEPGATAADLPQVALGLVEEAVAPRSPTDWPLADAVAWVRRELPDLAVAAWAAQLSGDTGVEQARAREQWTARVRGGWTMASYGSGSFIVAPPSPRPPARRSSPDYEGPSPPTRDQWWERADPDTRSQWLFAYFGEHSDLFEVGPQQYTPCTACSGAGVETVPAPSGEPLRRLCLRCAGVGADATVSFR